MDDKLYFPPEDDDADYFEDDLEPERFWTGRRIILTAIILITLIAFLAYSLQGLLFRPPPLPTPVRLPPMI